MVRASASLATPSASGSSNTWPAHPTATSRATSYRPQSVRGRRRAATSIRSAVLELRSRLRTAGMDDLADARIDHNSGRK